MLDASASSILILTAGTGRCSVRRSRDDDRGRCGQSHTHVAFHSHHYSVFGLHPLPLIKKPAVAVTVAGVRPSAGPWSSASYGHERGIRQRRRAGAGGAEEGPFSGHLFAFRGRKADTIKIVFWETANSTGEPRSARNRLERSRESHGALRL
jgi:hypothetical protein